MRAVPPVEVFVGREAELAELASGWDAAASGSGQLILLLGEPGIGKTRIAEHFAEATAGTGVRVVWGHAGAGETPAYWPWIPVVRELLDEVEPGWLRERLGSYADELDRLAGGVAEDADVTGGPAAGHLVVDLPTRRFLMFEAVSRFLRAITEEQPLVVVLEDVHWAGEASLRLLRHVSDQLGGARLLIVATLRDTQRPGVGAEHSVLDSPAGRTRLVKVGGLTSYEVGAYLEKTLGKRPPTDLVDRVCSRTGGNPLFLREVTRLLIRAPQDWHAQLPAGVPGLVARRVAVLPGDVGRLVRLAAVCGVEFEVELLERASAPDVGQVVEAVDHAKATGFFVAVPDGQPRRLRFAHSLLRDAVYQSLDAPDRSRLHRQVARAWERIGPAACEEHAGELARHWMAAGHRAGFDRAASYAMLAAHKALADLAYEDAVRLGRLALTAVDSAYADNGVRAEVLLLLARAEYLAGSVTNSVEHCRQAAIVARQAGRFDLIGEAALVVRGIGDPTIAADTALLCREALAGILAMDTPLRARLLGALAVAEFNSRRPAAAEQPSRMAVEMAERLGDPAALAVALHARQVVVSGPAGVAERLSLGDRMVEVARTSGQAVDQMWGHLWRIDAMFQLGAVAALDSELKELQRLAVRCPLPLLQWHLLRTQAALAQMTGRYADAHRLADEALEVGRRNQVPGSQIVQALLFALDAELGRSVPEREAISRAVAERTGEEIGWANLLHVYLALDRIEEARDCYQQLKRTLPVLPTNDGRWLPIVLLASEGAVAFADRGTAAWLYEALSPFVESCYCSGAGQVACLGSVARWLGLLATCLGRLTEAEEHFRQAQATNERIGAMPYVAHTRYAYASMLLNRNQGTDLAKALRLAEAAARTARDLGMRPLLARSARLVADVRAEQRRAIPLSAREREVALMVAQGLSNRRIAERLVLSERTVESHVSNALSKLGLDSRAQVAGWALRHGLLDVNSLADADRPADSAAPASPTG